MKKHPAISMVVLIGLASSCISWAVRSREWNPSARSRWAILMVENQTDGPVFLYMDGQFLARCEPNLKYTLRSRRDIKVSLWGRCRCDTWGPHGVHMTSGKTAVWRLGDWNRQGSNRQIVATRQ